MNNIQNLIYAEQQKVEQASTYIEALKKTISSNEKSIKDAEAQIEKALETIKRLESVK